MALAFFGAINPRNKQVKDKFTLPAEFSSVSQAELRRLTRGVIDAESDNVSKPMANVLRDIGGKWQEIIELLFGDSRPTKRGHDVQAVDVSDICRLLALVVKRMKDFGKGGQSEDSKAVEESDEKSENWDCLISCLQASVYCLNAFVTSSKSAAVPNTENIGSESRRIISEIFFADKWRSKRPKPTEEDSAIDGFNFVDLTHLIDVVQTDPILLVDVLSLLQALITGGKRFSSVSDSGVTVCVIKRFPESQNIIIDEVFTHDANSLLFERCIMSQPSCLTKLLHLLKSSELPEYIKVETLILITLITELRSHSSRLLTFQGLFFQLIRFLREDTTSESDYESEDDSSIPHLKVNITSLSSSTAKMVFRCIANIASDSTSRKYIVEASGAIVMSQLFADFITQQFESKEDSVDSSLYHSFILYLAALKAFVVLPLEFPATGTQKKPSAKTSQKTLIESAAICNAMSRQSIVELLCWSLLVRVELGPTEAQEQNQIGNFIKEKYPVAKSICFAGCIPWVICARIVSIILRLCCSGEIGLQRMAAFPKDLGEKLATTHLYSWPLCDPFAVPPAHHLICSLLHKNTPENFRCVVALAVRKIIPRSTQLQHHLLSTLSPQDHVFASFDESAQPRETTDICSPPGRLLIDMIKQTQTQNAYSQVKGVYESPQSEFLRQQQLDLRRISYAIYVAHQFLIGNDDSKSAATALSIGIPQNSEKAETLLLLVLGLFSTLAECTAKQPTKDPTVANKSLQEPFLEHTLGSDPFNRHAVETLGDPSLGHLTISNISSMYATDLSAVSIGSVPMHLGTTKSESEVCNVQAAFKHCLSAVLQLLIIWMDGSICGIDVFANSPKGLPVALDLLIYRESSIEESGKQINVLAAVLLSTVFVSLMDGFTQDNLLAPEESNSLFCDRGQVICTPQSILSSVTSRITLDRFATLLRCFIDHNVRSNHSFDDFDPFWDLFGNDILKFPTVHFDTPDAVFLETIKPRVTLALTKFQDFLSTETSNTLNMCSTEGPLRVNGDVSTVATVTKSGDVEVVSSPISHKLAEPSSALSSKHLRWLVELQSQNEFMVAELKRLGAMSGNESNSCGSVNLQTLKEDGYRETIAALRVQVEQLECKLVEVSESRSTERQNFCQRINALEAEVQNVSLSYEQLEEQSRSHIRQWEDYYLQSLSNNQNNAGHDCSVANDSLQNVFVDKDSLFQKLRVLESERNDLLELVALLSEGRFQLAKKFCG